jgi:hypothetical protein
MFRPKFAVHGKNKVRPYAPPRIPDEWPKIDGKINNLGVRAVQFFRNLPTGHRCGADDEKNAPIPLQEFHEWGNGLQFANAYRMDPNALPPIAQRYWGINAKILPPMSPIMLPSPRAPKKIGAEQYKKRQKQNAIDPNHSKMCENG